MGDSRNLSFSTTFNQQKILINDSQTVTIPTSVGVIPDSLFTVTTGALDPPTFRAFYEISGVLYPIWRAPGTLPSPLALDIAAGIDLSNNFFIRTLNLDPPVANVTFYYRVYIDSEP